MASPLCSPESACPGFGLEMTDSGEGIQIAFASSVTYDANNHVPILYDCNVARYLGWRSNYRIYTEAERLALGGGALFEGLTVYETDTNRVLLYDGTGWIIMQEPEQTFTPTFTGVTDGSATKEGRYRRSGGFIDLFASWLFGAGSAVTGPVALTLPINIDADFTRILAEVDFIDSGSVTFDGKAIVASVSSLTINALDASGARLAPAAVTSTSPLTFAAADGWRIHARYPMTTLYS